MLNITYYCDMCQTELDSELKCWNEDFNGTGERCPLYGEAQIWQEMLVQNPDKKENENG